MLKKTIKFIDYDGNPRSEDHYFHLSMSELSELQYGSEGGLEGITRRIIDTNDQTELVRIFKDLILRSYGERIGDAKNFMKEDDDGRPLSRRFKQTAAYDALWMELIQNTNAAIDFVNGIVPKELSEKMHEQLDKFRTDNPSGNDAKQIPSVAG